MRNSRRPVVDSEPRCPGCGSTLFDSDWRSDVENLLEDWTSPVAECESPDCELAGFGPKTEAPSKWAWLGLSWLRWRFTPAPMMVLFELREEIVDWSCDDKTSDVREFDPIEIARVDQDGRIWVDVPDLFGTDTATKRVVYRGEVR